MQDIINQIDKLFVEGITSGMISIIFYTFFYCFINKFLNKLILKQSWKNKSTIKRIKTILIYTLYGVSIVSQFTFTKDLGSTLLASGGIVAVVVGLASQEAASSIVSGMMIVTSKPFEIGDTIILQEYSLRGTVKEITINHTVIETIEKNSIIVPNTIMNKTIIENITQEEENKIAYLLINISYESDIHKAIQIMKDVIVSHPLFYDMTNSQDEEKVPVHCLEFKDNGISLRAKITTRSAGDSFNLCSDCRILIKEEFDKNNIEIPYPHVQIKH